MKKIIILFTILLVNVAFAQTITEVVSVDTTLTKANLYSNALGFFALEFKSANDVIQMKDVETGKVIGKGIVDGRSITIGISCKNGKYKYDIDIAPYKNLIPVDILFGINKFGMYNGITKGNLIWTNGISTVSNIKFIYDNEKNIRGNSWIVEYDGNGTPAMMAGAYKKWRVLVDGELVKLNKKYADMSNPNEERNKVIINNLLADLKREMSKKSDW